MKYNENNKPLVCMMTQSTCYRGTRKFTPKGVLWHSTGANNPNLKRYVQPDDNASNRNELINKIGYNGNGNDWNHTSVQAGLNFWIGKLADGTVAAVQTMPWDYRPWGCADGPNGSCNDTHIQFEICEDALTDKTYFDACYKEACEVTAYLCKMYNIDPKGMTSCGRTKVPTILDHTGSHSYGCGSDHADVQHWFKRYGKTMDNVRNDVANLLKVQAPTPPNKATKPIDQYIVNYKSHVQTFGWLGTVGDGETSGTVGQGLRLEGIQINIPGYDVTYQVHQQSIGDTPVAKNGQTCGTVGKGLRVEAIKIDCKKLKLQYRAQLQGIGWTEWTTNGKWCGTKGEGRRLEAVEIKVVNASKKTVKYQVHQQSYGWLPWVENGATAGYTGQSKRLESIIIDGDAKFKYQVHQQTYGDSKVFKNGQQAGVTGQAKRLESVKIDCDKKIKYRVHQQSYGWLPWVGNGEWSGIRGEAKRIEAIEIKFV